MDDTYFYQRKLRKRATMEIDLRFLKEKKLMCQLDKLKFMEKKIPINKSLISFIGKGDYHYFSFIFLKLINEPFVLLVIDNHLDMRYSKDNFIRCDSWIYNAGLLNNLKQIFYINSSNIDNIPEIMIPVYISIDKDIIDRKYLKTNWTQGNLSPDQLFEFLSKIQSKNKIIGVDICGEPEFNIEEIRKSEEINLSIVDIFKSFRLKKSA
ncbi:MAG: hypothetical protein QMD43_04820 [Thermodesulfovibrio sp.]|uniref:hypothetical protein n=1 Tax=unclassified Thermodesulfovibrio TaxID=2645936 RepID=UPI00085643BA|nr:MULTISPECIES: hypothetical protein [unclassified Thermodesulfovibrio]MDI1472619.1 hypothetical protein [Thermodesulfovibrio sp. 1176]MDI6714334.1 hypothetical protein [Thermodesulfovibrio sp.]ODA43650.1 Arginase [Thermodesulfovibrio sp. N1]